MQIYYHWLEYSIRPLKQLELLELLELLAIPSTQMTDKETKSGTRILTLTIAGKELAAITIPQIATGSMTLRGGYFDNFSNVPIHKIRDFMESKGGHLKWQDISYQDDKNIIQLDEYKYMSDVTRYKDYLAGSTTVSRKKQKKGSDNKPDSNNRQGIPDVHSNHPLIHYGDISGDSVKLYQAEGKQAKFELTIKTRSKGETLISLYDPENNQQWEDAVKSALVAALNFVTPASKKQKRPVQIESYRRFLGSAVKPIKYSHYAEQIQPETEQDVKDKLSRIIGQSRNFCSKHGILDKTNAAIESLESTIKSALAEL